MKKLAKLTSLSLSFFLGVVLLMGCGEQLTPTTGQVHNTAASTTATSVSSDPSAYQPTPEAATATSTTGAVTTSNPSPTVVSSGSASPTPQSASASIPGPGTIAAIPSPAPLPNNFPVSLKLKYSTPVPPGRNPFTLAIVVSSNGKTFASNGGEGVVKLWELTTGKELRAISGFPGTAYRLAFSHDGKILAGFTRDLTGSPNFVRLWDVNTGEELLRLATPEQSCHTLLFSPDDQELAGCNGQENITIWKIKDGEVKLNINGKPQPKQSIQVFGFYNQSGRNILVSGSGDSVKLWDAASGRLLNSFKKTDNLQYNADFDPVNKVLAVPTLSGAVELWDVTTGKTVKRIVNWKFKFTGARFSGDGATLAVQSDSAISLWDLRTGELLRTLSDISGGVNQIALSPDATRLISCFNDFDVKPMRVWNTATGQEIYSIPLSDRLSGVIFSPDGQKIATEVSTNHTIKIWNANDGKELATLVGHSDLVSQLIFSPDSKTLVSQSADSTVRVWEVESGKQIAVYPV